MNAQPTAATRAAERYEVSALRWKMPTLSCPHCGARGDSRDDAMFDVRGQAHGKVAYKWMACSDGFTKGVFGKARPSQAADGRQIERRFEEVTMGGRW